jgi:hypothetical protein
MHSRSKALVFAAIAALLLTACTSPTAVATHSDCGGGVATGTSTC